MIDGAVEGDWFYDPDQIIASSGTCTYPAIDVDSDGQIYVTYSYLDAFYVPYVIERPPGDGQSWTNNSALTGAADHRIDGKFYLDGDEHAIVSWPRVNGANRDMQFNRYNTAKAISGGAWAGEADIITDSGAQGNSVGSCIIKVSSTWYVTLLIYDDTDDDYELLYDNIADYGDTSMTGGSVHTPVPVTVLINPGDRDARPLISGSVLTCVHKGGKEISDTPSQSTVKVYDSVRAGWYPIYTNDDKPSVQFFQKNGDCNAQCRSVSAYASLSSTVKVYAGGGWESVLDEDIAITTSNGG
jgi:hypothetical protein